MKSLTLRVKTPFCLSFITCNKESASWSHVAWLVSFLALRCISVYWGYAESHVSGCFSATVFSVNTTNSGLTASLIAVPWAILSVFEGTFSKCGDCTPCPSLHRLPALSLHHFCWVLQTLAAASIWGRWDMALLGWKGELLSVGVFIVLPLKFPAFRILQGLSRGKLGEMWEMHCISTCIKYVSVPLDFVPTDFFSQEKK